MSKIWLVNWATEGDFDAECDDRSIDCPADMASNMVALVMAAYDEDVPTWGQICRSIAGMQEENHYIDEEDLLPPETSRVEFFVVPPGADGLLQLDTPKPGYLRIDAELDGSYWGTIIMSTRDVDLQE